MMMFRQFFLGLCVAIVSMTTLHAGKPPENYYRNFWYPTYHIQPLNYCALGDKTCGLPIAKQYCNLMGYQSVDKVIMEHNVGVANYIGTRARCIGWKCNGFSLIRCVSKMSHKPPKAYAYRSRTFVYPRFNHYRVDWCFETGKDCGKRAAFSFCRRMGYMKEQGYKIEKSVQATKTIGTHALCFGPNCNAFERITCYR